MLISTTVHPIPCRILHHSLQPHNPGLLQRTLHKVYRSGQLFLHNILPCYHPTFLQRFMRSFIIINPKISRIILRFLTLYLRDIRLHGSHAVCTITVMQLSIIFSCKMIVATTSSVSFITNIFQKESFHKISPLFYFQWFLYIHKIETYLESIVDQVNLIKDALKK